MRRENVWHPFWNLIKTGIWGVGNDQILIQSHSHFHTVLSAEIKENINREQCLRRPALIRMKASLCALMEPEPYVQWDIKLGTMPGKLASGKLHWSEMQKSHYAPQENPTDGFLNKTAPTLLSAGETGGDALTPIEARFHQFRIHLVHHSFTILLQYRILTSSCQCLLLKLTYAPTHLSRSVVLEQFIGNTFSKLFAKTRFRRLLMTRNKTEKATSLL